MFQINTTSFLKCCHLTNNIELGLATPAQAWWTAQFFMQFHADSPARWEAQGHGWGQRWKSKHGSNIQLTHPFRSMSIWHPILSFGFFNIWTCKSKVKVKLDESTARRQLKSPQSLSGRSIPLVTFEAWSSINMFAFRFMAIGPFLAEI